MSKAIRSRRARQAATGFAINSMNRAKTHGESIPGNQGGTSRLKAGEQWLAHDGAGARARRLKQMVRRQPDLTPAERAEAMRRIDNAFGRGPIEVAPGVQVGADGRTDAGLVLP